MKALGIIFLIAGIFTVAYSFNMNTTVDVPVNKYTENVYKYNQIPNKVNNIGLMNDRQNVLILGGVISIIGTILIVSGSKNKIISRDVTCPHCNEPLELTDEEINEGKYICEKCSSTVAMI